MSLLSIDDLHVRYGAIQALRGISLEVDEGEIVGLIGVNGAGKSTTMLSTMGVVRPVQGSITYRGQTLVGQSPESILRRGIAPVMEGRRIFPSLTVEENLRLGASTMSDRAQIQEELDRWTDFFPILRERLQQPA